MIKSFLLVILVSVLALAGSSSKDVNAKIWPDSRPKNLRLSSMQKHIQDCQFELTDLNLLNTFKDIYDSLDKKYLILSQKTVQREIFYKSESQKYKLKVIHDKITNSKIDDQGKVKNIPVDTKNKVSTVKGRIQQALLNSEIESDWGRYSEVREKGIEIEYRLTEDKMTHLVVMNMKLNLKLACSIKSEVDVCLCGRVDESKQ